MLHAGHASSAPEAARLEYSTQAILPPRSNVCGSHKHSNTPACPYAEHHLCERITRQHSCSRATSQGKGASHPVLLELIARAGLAGLARLRGGRLLLARRRCQARASVAGVLVGWHTVAALPAAQKPSQHKSQRHCRCMHAVLSPLRDCWGGGSACIVLLHANCTALLG